MSPNRSRRALLLTLVAALALGTAAPAALAAKGGGGKPGGGGSATSSMALVLLDSSDGLAHWGGHLRFDVRTTATTQPHVDLKCSQAGALVYSATTGYYDAYPWPWTQTFQLSSQSWAGGDADCSAVLYKLANSGAKTTLSTLAFHAYA